MKPFLGSVLTIAVIAVVSSIILANVKMSSQDVYQSQSGNVRLGDGVK
jgi:hypothetical protein